MIVINSDMYEKLNHFTDQTTYVVTDFDRTLTANDSPGSWQVLDYQNNIPQEYLIESKKLFNYYRPIEIDETIEWEEKNKRMNEWWEKHASLLVDLQLTRQAFEKFDVNVMKFRAGAKELLREMFLCDIPVIIESAGIGNFIESFLIENDCYYNNIDIVANFVKFEQELLTGFSNQIIHTLNKSDHFFTEDIKAKIFTRDNVFVFGDVLTDANMVTNQTKNIIKIGFLEANEKENKELYQKVFDMVCTNNTSFDQISKNLNKSYVKSKKRYF